jgi:hypothetical protein
VNRPPVRLGECRECHEPIVFARLDTGKAIPLNPRPDPRGNVACRMQSKRLIGFVISRDRLPGPFDIWRMVPHHATCEERKTKTKPAPEPDVPLF